MNLPAEACQWLLLVPISEMIYPTTGSLAPTVRFAPNPAILSLKKTNEDGSEFISIETLLETRCPSLFKAYRPAWWLCNGHLQTAYTVLTTFSKEDPILYQRTYLRLADEGTIALDFAPADQSKVRSDAPIVVIQHGLTGGSHEHYIREVLTVACAPIEQNGLGYRAVVINFRGCAGVPITSPMFYSAGSTDDTRQALMYLKHKYPDAPLIGLGFSLGANVLTRYLGEEGEQSKLLAGCALGCPWDLNRNGESLVNSVLGTHLYSKGLGGGLVRLIQKHLAALTKDPEHEVAIAARKALCLKSPTLDKFDDTFTVIAGGPSPHFPFPDVATYYKWVSSHNMLDRIRVPFLSINAEDDPVIKHVPMEHSDNGLVVMVLTRNGGHLGWYQSGSQSTDRWTTKPVLEWLKLAADVSRDEKPAPTLSIDEGGFLREEGSPRFGCKVVDEEFVDAEGQAVPDILMYKLIPGLQSFTMKFVRT